MQIQHDRHTHAGRRYALDRLHPVETTQAYSAAMKAAADLGPEGCWNNLSADEMVDAAYSAAVALGLIE